VTDSEDNVETTTSGDIHLGLLHLKRSVKRSRAGQFAAGTKPGPGRPKKRVETHHEADTITAFIAAANEHAATIAAATQTIRALGNEPTRQAILDKYTRTRARQILRATAYQTQANQLATTIDTLAHILIADVVDDATQQKLLAHVDDLLKSLEQT
jgi:predicted ArsR family transcriptional regulator